MAFTEFACRSGGSNLNAGTRTGNSTEPGTSADFTYASGTWVSATGVFTVASGNPSTDGVAVGDFASVYADGASVTTLVGRVTAVSSTTVTVSTTAKAGATTDGALTRTMKIGGAWQGPNGASCFPISLSTATSSVTNAAGDPVRFNLKNTASYAITASMLQGAPNAAPGTTFQGYTSSYGDFGKATIDGGAGAGFVLWGANLITQWNVTDIIFNATFSSGTGGGFVVSGGGTGSNFVLRCAAIGTRGIGFGSGSNSSQFIECEASGGTTGFQLAHGGAGIDTVIDCIAHDNTGVGFLVSGGGQTQIRRCIADTNGSHGFHISASPPSLCIESCDSYNNTGDGIRVTNVLTTPFMIRNSNLIKNGGFGINVPSTVATRRSQYLNCGFGSGSQVNTSGTIGSVGNAYSTGHVTYAADVTPWVDPANGDFRINLAAAKGVGRGSFTQTAASYAGTVGYPDIGAAQSAGGGGSTLIVIED